MLSLLLRRICSHLRRNRSDFDSNGIGALDSVSGIVCIRPGSYMLIACTSPATIFDVSPVLSFNNGTTSSRSSAFRGDPVRFLCEASLLVRCFGLESRSCASFCVLEGHHNFSLSPFTKRFETNLRAKAIRIFPPIANADPT